MPVGHEPLLPQTMSFRAAALIVGLVAKLKASDTFQSYALLAFTWRFDTLLVGIPRDEFH